MSLALKRNEVRAMRPSPASAQSLRVAVILCIAFAGCAAGDERFTGEDPAGFWIGLWHGLIACVALVIGIFSDSVEVYERSNTGGWYDLGFLIGVGVFSGGGHKSHRRWRDGKRNGREKDAPSKGGSARVTVDIEWDGDESSATASDRPVLKKEIE